jgi:hypothetical protein
VVVVAVGDQGDGYDLWTKVEHQYLQMKANDREHGLARIFRLSDLVLPRKDAYFEVSCTLYDIRWPGSLCDEYKWCEAVILDYTGLQSVWFGRVRYALWWQSEQHEVFMGQWAVLSALNSAIDNQIPQLMNAYLQQLVVSPLSYLFFEIRGHGPTEPERPSAETIAETLETYFASHFAAKKVLLYASKGEYHKTLKTLADKYALPLYLSEKSCLAGLKMINRGMSAKDRI